MLINLKYMTTLNEFFSSTEFYDHLLLSSITEIEGQKLKLDGYENDVLLKKDGNDLLINSENAIYLNSCDVIQRQKVIKNFLPYPWKKKIQ
mgnify:CR=1 FL=1